MVGREPQSPTLLEVENLEVVYNRVIVAVHGASLRVAPGSIVALLGTNGAGKTSTVRAISGFLPVDDADIRKGSLRFGGASLAGRSPIDIARMGLVLVPERRKIFETMTVIDNLRLARARVRTSGSWQDMVDRVMTIFPALGQRREQIAGYMSGGERQMLAIGQALLCGPKVLLIDELSLGLAPHLIEQLMASLVTLRAELDISILIIEQDAASALEIADYAYIMEGGRIVYEGAPDKLRGHQDVQEFYLGTGASTRANYRDVKQYRRSRRWWG